MIILNLVIFNEQQINDVVNYVLKNKWALNVIVSNAMDSYYMDRSTVESHSSAHTIQFTTKSMLFSEIETTLKNNFPDLDFIIYAVPAVHVDTVYYDKIKNAVPGGFTLFEKNES